MGEKEFNKTNCFLVGKNFIILKSQTNIILQGKFLDLGCYLKLHFIGNIFAISYMHKKD